MSVKQRLVLAIVATDRTFEVSRHGSDPVWVGACIHCRSPLTISATGRPISQATIETIWPRRHGGDNALANLALACGRCNRGKSSHDQRAKTDPKLLALVAELRRRRAERWREPPSALAAYVAWACRDQLPPEATAEPDDDD